ncbi:MAG: tRNA 2-selenouridine(34) synthase MnmH, partial [Daejeonella sp.]
GEQVIDLEDLAKHQGSSYGSMGTLVQPSQEHFENLLATELDQIDKSKSLWLEDESLTIGKRFIPNPLFNQMRIAPVYKLEIPLQERTNFLVEVYGALDKDFLVQCTERIGKRLGPEQTRDSINAIRENRMEDFIKLVLVYYDKTYSTGQSKRLPDTINLIPCPDTNAANNAKLLLKHISISGNLLPDSNISNLTSQI